MRGLQQYTKRGQVKPLAEQLLQGQHYGGHQISAATNRLGDDHIRNAAVAELSCRIDQIIEAAAKTGSGHFTYVEPLGAQIMSINKIGGLVVGDDGHVLAILEITGSQLPNQRRFSSA